MLKPLHPGIEALGIFDLEDDDHSLVKGGEVAIFEALDEATDGYAADVFQVGPRFQLSIGDVSAHSVMYGLVDEGTSSGDATNTGYGTMFGSLIGGAAGQGTGFGAMSTTGVVVIGPSTLQGSGKATLWTKPGLYGVTEDGWRSTAIFTAATLNSALYGHAEDGTNDGKLTTTASGNGVAVALCIGPVRDSSLVTTTAIAAGKVDAETEYQAIYLTGVQIA